MHVTRSKHWSKFSEDRAKRVRFTVQQSLDGAAFAAVDLSAATAKVYFRAYTAPPDALTASDYIVNQVVSKDSDGSDGKFEDYVTFTAGAGQVVCELVLVDEAVGSQPTPTTYREQELKKWHAEVSESVQP